MLSAAPAFAETAAGVTQDQFSKLSMVVGIMWWAIMFAIIFFMQAGFFLLESGSVRSKTASHVGAKIMIQIGLGVPIFFIVGFAIKAFGWPFSYILPWSGSLIDGTAFTGTVASIPAPGDAITTASGWIANAGGSFLPWAFNATPDLFMWAFFGSLMFMITSLAIPGTVFSERVSLKAHILFVAAYAAIIYPVFAWLIWGGLAGSPLLDPHSPLLQAFDSWFTPAVDSARGQALLAYGMVADGSGKYFYAPFTDYAGSIGVHMLGGLTGLVGAWYVGARIGKFVNGKPRAIPGHNVPLAVLGALLLAFCWFGFNGGSVIANYFNGPAGAGAGIRGLFISDFIFSDIWWVMIVTVMAMSGGVLGSMLGSWSLKTKPDPLVIANGMLGALVAVCSGAGFIHPMFGLLIGIVAGFQFPYTLRFVEHKLKIDDAIGTIACHTASGLVGCIMAGIWGQLFWWGIIPDTWVHPGGGMLSGSFIPTLPVELAGVGALFLWALPVTFITFYAIDKLVGVRVSMEEEIAGLDISEHGISAYPEFDHKESYLEVMGDGVSTAPGVVPVADTEKEA
jgi:Amt family ammonium transporter